MKEVKEIKLTAPSLKSYARGVLLHAIIFPEIQLNFFISKSKADLPNLT